MATPYLTREQLDTFFAHIAHPRDKLLGQLLYESGCSIKDITHLRAANVKADGTVRFADRTSSISPALATALRKDADEHVFSTRQGSSITAKRIQQILKPYLQAVTREKPTPHILRYTHIIHAYQSGVSLQAISQQTGMTLMRLSQILEGIERESTGYGAFFRSGKRGGAP